VTAAAFLPIAEDDLLEAWLHIAADNPPAPDQYIDRVRQVCALIAKNPAMGIERKDVRDGVRSFPVERHVIFYTQQNKDIVVLRVWPAAQDPVAFAL
jgi:toxin ParE1/3/4